jgi:hypothetical protein
MNRQADPGRSQELPPRGNTTMRPGYCLIFALTTAMPCFAGGEHALIIVHDEFRPVRLAYVPHCSIGLLAGRARLRFTGSPIVKCWTDPTKGIIIER